MKEKWKVKLLKLLGCAKRDELSLRRL